MNRQRNACLPYQDLTYIRDRRLRTTKMAARRRWKAVL
jgi:hypothetical protein